MAKYKLNIDRDRYNEAKKRVADYYNHRPVDKIPFCYRIASKGTPHYNMMEKNDDFSLFVEENIASFNYQAEHFPDTDFLPVFNFDLLGEGLIPSFFGAEQLVVENNPPFTKGRVLNEIADVYKLPKRIDPEHDGWGARLMRLCDICLDATNGDVPIGMFDLQSPYGLATKLIENEKLMLAMYDEPEATKYFLELMTQAIMDTIDAVEKRVGKANFAKNIAAPLANDRTGLILYDDYISVLNPKLHEEFCCPFNIKLYERYGRGHLHTCGPYFNGYIEPCLTCKPVSLDLTIMRGMSRTREDFLLFREITRRDNIILSGYPIISEGSIFEQKFIQPDEEFLTEMARGGILPSVCGQTYAEGIEATKMWERISKRVL